MRTPDDDRPHRKHCVCADCKADRDARYAALQAGTTPPAPRVAPPAPVPPPPAPVARPAKRREPYAETRVRDRRPRPKPPTPLRVARPTSTVSPPVRKEDARCCTSRRDEIGRLPIGFCSPECERRPR